MKIISLCSLLILLAATIFLLTELLRSRARCKTKIRDVHELRECIVDEWDKLDQCIKAIAKWQKRLQAYVVALGGQFEHTVICEHLSLLTFCHVLFLKGRPRLLGNTV